MLQAKITDFQIAKKFGFAIKLNIRTVIGNIIFSNGFINFPRLWKDCLIYPVLKNSHYGNPDGQLRSYRATQHNSLLPVANTKIKITDFYGSATWFKYNIANMNAEKSKSVMSINYTVRGACVKHNNI